MDSLNKAIVPRRGAPKSDSLLRAALFGKWSGESDYYIPRRMAIWYRLKAAICLLLNLKPPLEKTGKYLTSVTVTCIADGSYYTPGEPTVYWGEALVVGHGVFRSWWATVYQDSD